MVCQGVLWRSKGGGDGGGKIGCSQKIFGRVKYLELGKKILEGVVEKSRESEKFKAFAKKPGGRHPSWSGSRTEGRPLLRSNSIAIEFQHFCGRKVAHCKSFV